MTLLGDACQRQKEMTAKTADFVPLNGSEKHKVIFPYTTTSNDVNFFVTLKPIEYNNSISSMFVTIDHIAFKTTAMHFGP